MSNDWLPPLLTLSDFAGDWRKYYVEVYERFRKDWCLGLPQFQGKRVSLKRHPLVQGKEATYWHFITEGPVEDERGADIPRSERIEWPRAMLGKCPVGRPAADSLVLWWKNKRDGEERYVLALPELSYVFILADRGTYVLPWTAYIVKNDHQRQKFRKEYEGYWKTQP